MAKSKAEGSGKISSLVVKVRKNKEENPVSDFDFGQKKEAAMSPFVGRSFDSRFRMLGSPVPSPFPASQF